MSDTPIVSADATELTVVVDDGNGKTTTWTLTCDPAGGTHPDPEAACTILGAHGERALPPKREDVACPQVYGGPEKATVTGMWRGQRVRSTFSRTDGCEISRWDLMQGLLPRAGG